MDRLEAKSGRRGIITSTPALDWASCRDQCLCLAGVPFCSKVCRKVYLSAESCVKQSCLCRNLAKTLGRTLKWGAELDSDKIFVIGSPQNSNSWDTGQWLEYEHSCFGATSEGSQRLLLALHSEITSGGARGTVWNARNQSLVSCPLYYLFALTNKNFLNVFKILK